MPKKPLYPHTTPSQQKAVKPEPIVIHGRTIPEERIEDLLVNAFEGGSNYWYIINSFNYPPGQTKQSLGIEFAHMQLPLRGGSLSIGDIEDRNVKEKILDRPAIIKGLQLMADKYPRHWADFIEENDDAITADVFLQLAVWGEVIYG